jgi:hypothetical protein
MSKNKPKELKTDKYTIQVNYSEESINKKLMKFVTPGGEKFEISAEEMISFLVNQVNMHTLEPTFVETDKINMCIVSRQLDIVVNRDVKKGEHVRVDYSHPYPLEYGLLEQVYKIAKVEMAEKGFELSKELIDATREKITPEMEEFTKKFYEGHKGLALGNEPKI